MSDQPATATPDTPADEPTSPEQGRDQAEPATGKGLSSMVGALAAALVAGAVVLGFWLARQDWRTLVVLGLVALLMFLVVVGVGLARRKSGRRWWPLSPSRRGRAASSRPSAPTVGRPSAASAGSKRGARTAGSRATHGGTGTRRAGRWLGKLRGPSRVGGPRTTDRPKLKRTSRETGTSSRHGQAGPSRTATSGKEHRRRPADGVRRQVRSARNHLDRAAGRTGHRTTPPTARHNGAVGNRRRPASGGSTGTTTGSRSGRTTARGSRSGGSTSRRAGSARSGGHGASHTTVPRHPRGSTSRHRPYDLARRAFRAIGRSRTSARSPRPSKAPKRLRVAVGIAAGAALAARRSWAGLRMAGRKLFRNREPEQHPAEAYADQLRADARERAAAKSATKPEPSEMKPGRPMRRPNQKPEEKGDPPMANAPIEQAAEAVSAIGAWEPESITDIDHFLEDLGQLYEALASTQASLAQRFGSDLPIGAPVVEHLSELASGAASLTDHANQGRAIFRNHHEQEFHRIENPRPHEEMWDVTANQ